MSTKQIIHLTVKLFVRNSAEQKKSAAYKEREKERFLAKTEKLLEQHKLVSDKKQQKNRILYGKRNKGNIARR